VTKGHLQQLKTKTKETRREEVEPLANYNVFVLDPSPQNHQFHLSTQMLLETEVFVMEMYLLLVWDNTMKNTYNLSGNFKYSYVNDIADKKRCILL
jgi:hypothetical protein